MAMTLLEYSLENQAGFCVISGKAGTANNVVTPPAESNRQRCLDRPYIQHPSFFGELLRWILQAFGFLKTPQNQAQLHQIFVDYLIGQYAKNRRTMLIIDEAQICPPMRWKNCACCPISTPKKICCCK
jgi:hypothetical protein